MVVARIDVRMPPTRRRDLWGLVLAGGDGTRLQALTRVVTGAPIPKQYCRLAGDRSLLEATLARIEPLVDAERTLVVVNRDHVPLAGEQLGSLPAANVLVQPLNRDTGPGLLFSLLRLASRAPGAIVAVFPSDHYIRDDRAFLRHVEEAVELVRQRPDRMVLLGVRPDGPEPGLGYIEPGDALAAGAFRVAAFHEKPSAADAERIVARGGLWNSFVMAFRVETVLHALCETRPLDYRQMRAVVDHPELLSVVYPVLHAWNFSADFLARIPERLLAVATENIGWSDWGTPEAIARTLATLEDRPSWWNAVRALAAA
jgi:mannose-1-phosphate guanylyltransferase